MGGGGGGGGAGRRYSESGGGLVRLYESTCPSSIATLYLFECECHGRRFLFYFFVFNVHRALLAGHSRQETFGVRIITCIYSRWLVCACVGVCVRARVCVCVCVGGGGGGGWWDPNQHLKYRSYLTNWWPGRSWKGRYGGECKREILVEGIYVFFFVFFFFNFVTCSSFFIDDSLLWSKIIRHRAFLSQRNEERRGCSFC